MSAIREVDPENLLVHQRVLLWMSDPYRKGQTFTSVEIAAGLGIDMKSVRAAISGITTHNRKRDRRWMDGQSPLAFTGWRTRWRITEGGLAQAANIRLTVVTHKRRVNQEKPK